MKGSKAESWQLVAGSYFSHLLFLLFIFSAIYKGAAWLLPVALIMIVVPILDALTGYDLSLGDLDLSKMQECLIAVSPILFVLGNAAVVGFVAHTFARLTISERVFSVLSVGMIGSIGITAAHELVHKPGSVCKLFGRLGLANIIYLHFEINHIRGHHARVGTVEDQSTAWFDESLYHFFFRTLPGCLRESWKLENARLNRRGLATLSFRNQMVQFFFLQCAYIVGIGYLGGRTGILFFLLQAGIAVFMLEAVSYIEHYGLVRTKGDDGKYAPMTPHISWDSYGRFSNYLVFQLQRHADHHSHPTRSFSSLQTASESPQLPVGYPLLIGVAMVPPLWRRIMNPRVTAARSASSRE